MEAERVNCADNAERILPQTDESIAESQRFVVDEEQQEEEEEGARSSSSPSALPPPPPVCSSSSYSTTSSTASAAYTNGAEADYSDMSLSPQPQGGHDGDADDGCSSGRKKAGNNADDEGVGVVRGGSTRRRPSSEASSCGSRSGGSPAINPHGGEGGGDEGLGDVVNHQHRAHGGDTASCGGSCADEGERRGSSGCGSTGSSAATVKDEVYWERRRRNNDAAKRSREKRRLNDMAMEKKLAELAEENERLKSRLVAASQHQTNSNATTRSSPFATAASTVAHKNSNGGGSVIVAGPSLTTSSPTSRCCSGGAAAHSMEVDDRGTQQPRLPMGTHQQEKATSGQQAMEGKLGQLPTYGAGLHWPLPPSIQSTSGSAFTIPTCATSSTPVQQQQQRCTSSPRQSRQSVGADLQSAAVAAPLLHYPNVAGGTPLLFSHRPAVVLPTAQEAALLHLLHQQQRQQAAEQQSVAARAQQLQHYSVSTNNNNNDVAAAAAAANQLQLLHSLAATGHNGGGGGGSGRGMLLDNSRWAPTPSNSGGSRIQQLQQLAEYPPRVFHHLDANRQIAGPNAPMVDLPSQSSSSVETASGAAHKHPHLSREALAVLDGKHSRPISNEKYNLVHPLQRGTRTPPSHTHSHRQQMGSEQSHRSPRLVGGFNGNDVGEVSATRREDTTAMEEGEVGACTSSGVGSVPANSSSSNGQQPRQQPQQQQQRPSLLGSLLATKRRSPSVPESRTERMSGLVVTSPPHTPPPVNGGSSRLINQAGFPPIIRTNNEGSYPTASSSRPAVPSEKDPEHPILGGHRSNNPSNSATTDHSGSGSSGHHSRTNSPSSLQLDDEHHSDHPSTTTTTSGSAGVSSSVGLERIEENNRLESGGEKSHQRCYTNGGEFGGNEVKNGRPMGSADGEEAVPLGRTAKLRKKNRGEVFEKEERGSTSPSTYSGEEYHHLQHLRHRLHASPTAHHPNDGSISRVGSNGASEGIVTHQLDDDRLAMRDLSAMRLMMVGGGGGMGGHHYDHAMFLGGEDEEEEEEKKLHLGAAEQLGGQQNGQYPAVLRQRNGVDLERYIDRRRRNNEAAKRCRANRRTMFEYRSRRAQQLETENGELRQEMLKLSNELEQLKAMLAAKQGEGLSATDTGVAAASHHYHQRHGIQLHQGHAATTPATMGIAPSTLISYSSSHPQALPSHPYCHRPPQQSPSYHDQHPLGGGGGGGGVEK